MKGTYNGRLVCDGNGNLLADETIKVGEQVVTVHDPDGEPLLDEHGRPMTITIPIVRHGKNHGAPVAFHEGSFVFVESGEPSHNERHHENAVTVEATVDAGMTDDDDLVNAYIDGENQHHFGPLEDDPHFDRNAPNNTRLIQLPDKQAATTSGHTEAYRG